MQGISDDNLARLERLDKLRQSGAITHGEFEQAKSRLLGNSSPAGDLSSADSPTGVSVETSAKPLPKDSLRNSGRSGLSAQGERGPTNMVIAWSVAGAVLAVVFLAILLIPFSGERGAACSGAIVQVFESKPSYDYSNGPPDLSKMTSNYRFCRNEAKSRVGIGATGLVITGLITGGGYLATRPRQQHDE